MQTKHGDKDLRHFRSYGPVHDTFSSRKSRTGPRDNSDSRVEQFRKAYSVPQEPKCRECKHCNLIVRLCVHVCICLPCRNWMQTMCRIEGAVHTRKRKRNTSQSRERGPGLLRSKVLGLFVDSEIDLSTRNDNTGFPVPSHCFLLPGQI